MKKVSWPAVQSGVDAMSVHSEADGVSLLEEKIEEAQRLLAAVKEQFNGTDGVNKFSNKINAEIKFLNNVILLCSCTLTSYC